MLNMFDHLQISDRRERFLVGTADLVLEAVSPMITRHSRRSSAGADRILVLRLERVGDFLMALPGIRAVRRLAPHARIDLVVGSWSAALAGAIADVDQVEILDVPWMARERRGAGWSALLDRAREWRQREYDVGINLEGDIRSNLLLGMSGAVRRAGFAMRGGGPLLTDPVEFAEAAHTATNIRRLVGHAFNADVAGVDDNDAWENLDTGRWPVSDEASAQAGAVLAEHGAAGTLIGIQASAGREIKQWDPDRFAQVGTALAREYDATLVVTGTEGERRVTERLKNGVGADVHLVDLTGNVDLPTLGGLISRMALFITCDTGPMHLAAAVGTPIVAIFGPSLPSRFAPLSARSRVVRVDLPCSPCNQLRRPPSRCVGHIPDCLVGVEVSHVLAAAHDLLGPGPMGGQSIVQASTEEP